MNFDKLENKQTEINVILNFIKRQADRFNDPEHTVAGKPPTENWYIHQLKILEHNLKKLDIIKNTKHRVHFLNDSFDKLSYVILD